MKEIRVAAFQTRVWKDKEKNLQQMEALMAGVSESADLVTFPEMFICPYESACFAGYAEKTGGRTWQRFSYLAKKHSVYLSAGTVPELGEDGKLYNTAYVFDREGCQIGKYRKMHLFDIDVEGGQHFRESDTLAPGEELTVFDTEFGRIGLCICYDLRFPELMRLMTDAGAFLILVPAAFNMTTGPDHWELLFRARAVDNQVYMLGTAPARDMTASYHSWGHSILTDPWGSVIGQLDGEAGWLQRTLDLEVPGRIRAQLPLLKHRRKDVYSLSLNRETLLPGGSDLSGNADRKADN